jgi:UPF0042 nucleotide-binding protein
MKTSSKTKNGNRIIRIIACGFKFGAPPPDAALVIDCRGLVNPHYDPKLRPKTGASRAVASYLEKDEEVRALLVTVAPLLKALLPGLITRSNYHKEEVKLVFACTGGKHRSRFFALHAAGIVRHLIASHPSWDCTVVINYRDQGLEKEES